MEPLAYASGNLTAERRADYAEMLFASGDHAAAPGVMINALELTPKWAMGWFRLGEMHEAAGDMAKAAAAWRMCLLLEPDDRPGAALKLEIIGAMAPSPAPPSAFVEALFDQYASTFDAALVDRLAYRVPALLEEAISRTARSHFGHAIDLGCGTGLMGERLRPFVDRLEGYDISASMLKKARAKKVYDMLAKADLQVLDLSKGVADIVTAADVLIYVGALERMVATVAAGLKDGGLFAFSVEKHVGPQDFELKASRRYAHSERYLLNILAVTGLKLLSFDNAVIRLDRSAAIDGFIIVAVRAG